MIDAKMIFSAEVISTILSFLPIETIVELNNIEDKRTNTICIRAGQLYIENRRMWNQYNLNDLEDTLMKLLQRRKIIIKFCGSYHCINLGDTIKIYAHAHNICQCHDYVFREPYTYYDILDDHILQESFNDIIVQKRSLKALASSFKLANDDQQRLSIVKYKDYIVDPRKKNIAVKYNKEIEYEDYIVLKGDIITKISCIFVETPNEVFINLCGNNLALTKISATEWQWNDINQRYPLLNYGRNFFVKIFPEPVKVKYTTAYVGDARGLFSALSIVHFQPRTDNRQKIFIYKAYDVSIRPIEMKTLEN